MCVCVEDVKMLTFSLKVTRMDTQHVTQNGEGCLG